MVLVEVPRVRVATDPPGHRRDRGLDHLDHVGDQAVDQPQRGRVELLVLAEAEP
jgi:hypothetical protein